MKKNLLLIEDHAPLRVNLHEILSLEGFHVVTADDGPSGLLSARNLLPDLILCDIMLPGMDGLEILAHLRGSPITASIPFIFLTAKGEPSDIRMGMRLGADDYLAKPVSRIDLLDAVKARLARAAQQRTFAPNFESPAPLVVLGISKREAEVLLWMAQGKAYPEIGTILGLSPATVKKHALHILEKLGVESRAAAMLCALEVLSQ